MTSDQAEKVLRLLSGHWPIPEMSDDELRVWHRTLAPLDPIEAARVVDALAATGMPMRPTDGRFTAEYRHAMNRHKPWPALEYVSDANPETVARELASAREALHKVAS